MFLWAERYGVTLATVGASFFYSWIEKIFGLDALGFFAFLAMFLVELISGVIASQIRKEPFSSMKLARFTCKIFFYLFIIFVPFVMSASFAAHHKLIPSLIFDWLHMFLVTQIVLENMYSVLENIAVITGKEKTAMVSIIQRKVASMFSIEQNTKDLNNTDKP